MTSTVTPVWGEAFDGYLARASHHLNWPLEIVWRSLGLHDPSSGTSLAIHLDPHQITQLDQQWRTAHGTARSMTVLGRFPAIGYPKDPTNPMAFTRLATKRWFFIAGGRYCPQCLNKDGVWRVEWRLPWTIACSDHGIYLHDSCPTCGAWPQSGSNNHARRVHLHSHTLNPRTCNAPLGYSQGVASQVCAGDYTHVTPTPADPQALTAQRTIINDVQNLHTTVAGIPMNNSQALTAWIELTLLASHALGATGKRRRLSPIRHVAHMTPHITLAHTIGSTSTLDEAQHELTRTLTRQRYIDKNWFRDRLPRKQSPLAPLYEKVLSTQGRFSTQLRRHTQQALSLYPVTAEQIPQRAWPCALPKQLLEIPGRPTLPMRQAFVSLSLARVLTGDWTSAAQHLDFPSKSGAQWARYVISQIPKDMRTSVSQEILQLLPIIQSAPQYERKPISDASQLKQALTGECKKHNEDAWCPCLQ